jgi:RHS repeat-associated protein
MIDAAYDAPSSSGDVMSRTYTIKEPGYAYLYYSNEHPTQVNAYFDNVSITHTPSPIIQMDDYYAFGLAFNSYSRENSLEQDYRFNGKEEQDELGINWLDYGARMYDPTIGRWWAVDPLSELSRKWSPYSYCYNNPIIFIDPDGMFGDYYSNDGKYLGNDGVNDDKVYAVKEGGVLSTAQDGDKTLNMLDPKSIVDLGISHTAFLGFAALIHNESGGAKDESYAIANVTMNFLGEGGSSSLKTLEDVSLYNNSFAQGATQKNYTSFKSFSHQEQNSKFAVAAAINAIGYSKGYQGYSDYSNGADSWDGIDLIASTWENSHRDYSWSEDSRQLLNKYKTDFNGGVNVAGFVYKETGYQIAATAIIGRTLYTNLKTPRGEGKEGNKMKFK